MKMIQVINLAAFLLIAGLSLYWAIRNPFRRLYAVPPFLLGLHGVSFYLALCLRDFLHATFVSDDLTLWSAVLRSHEILTVLLMVVAVYYGTIRIVVELGTTGEIRSIEKKNGF